jgi:Uma2 family endonuclease
MPALSQSVAPPAQAFANGDEWIAALGNIPLSRVIFSPWPGTATEADLLRFVERDKRLCELLDGTLVEKPIGCWEGLIAANLITILGLFVNDRDLGAVFGPDSTMRMKSGRIRLPDVGFVSKSRLPTTCAAVPTLSPDLAIEVLSESNTADEMNMKLVEYFQSGTKLAWIVDPKTRSVAVHHKPGKPAYTVDEASHIQGGDVLPGLSFPVAEMFRNVPRGE